MHHKIKKIISYTKKFILSRNKAFAIKEVFIHIKKFGFKNGVQKFLSLRAKSVEPVNNSVIFCSGEIICVGHDAAFNGAQILLLNIIKNFVIVNKVKVHLFLAEGGVLIEEYKKYVSSINILNIDNIDMAIGKLYNAGVRYALVNSSASGNITKILAKHGINTTVLIHELPWAIKNYHIEEAAKNSAMYANRLIFPADFVKEKFNFLNYIITTHEQLIQPQGLYMKNVYQNDPLYAYQEMRSQLNLNQNDKIVLGCGYGDYRKGVDLFCSVANSFIQTNVKFLWLGNITGDMQKFISESTNVIQLPASNDRDFISKVIASSDIFFISSREDPFPSVVMEALSVGKPVVGFSGCGGFTELIDDQLGILCDINDLDSVTEAINKLLSDKDDYLRISNMAREIIESKFNFNEYCLTLLEYLDVQIKSVSVIVPNFNYANYLPQRLKTIVDQNYPLKEIIILDDASSDNSMDVINKFILDFHDFNIKVIRNLNNSGSVFKQWFKGISIATGQYIWIAEADDLCDERFVYSLVSNFRDNTVLAYSQSKQTDENNSVLANDYLAYTSDISTTKWLGSYHYNGIAEIKEALCIKNTIPNVSGVIFRNIVDDSILSELLKFKIAGDWLFYCHILSKGGIYFHSESLNYHRRHNSSVTKIGFGQTIYDEIKSMQDYLANTYELPKVAITKIEAYRNELKTQFGVFDE